MGRRTKRFLHHQVKENLGQFDQREVQLVCWNGSTYAGLARARGGVGLEITDKNSAWYNRKKHVHLIQLSDIKEVMIDEISAW